MVNLSKKYKFNLSPNKTLLPKDVNTNRPLTTVLSLLIHLEKTMVVLDRNNITPPPPWLVGAFRILNKEKINNIVTIFHVDKSVYKSQLQIFINCNMYPWLVFTLSSFS